MTFSLTSNQAASRQCCTAPRPHSHHGLVTSFQQSMASRVGGRAGGTTRPQAPLHPTPLQRSPPPPPPACLRHPCQLRATAAHLPPLGHSRDGRPDLHWPASPPPRPHLRSAAAPPPPIPPERRPHTPHRILWAHPRATARYLPLAPSPAALTSHSSSCLVRPTKPRGDGRCRVGPPSLKPMPWNGQW